MSGGTRAADVTATFAGVTISDLEFHARIIHCKEPAMAQRTQLMYSIPMEVYNCFEVKLFLIICIIKNTIYVYLLL